MLSKTMQMSKYLISVLYIAIYGLISYFVFIWLIGYSQLYAYLGNLALIVIVLAIDELTIKMIQSEKFVARIKKETDSEKKYLILERGLGMTHSFKTELYLFYVFVLIGSQVIEFSPGLAGGNLGSFILANNYSILLLIAFDTLISQFTKDREKIKKVVERLRNSFIEKQD